MKKPAIAPAIGKYLGITSVAMFALQIARQDMLFAFVWMCIGAISLGLMLGNAWGNERHESIGWWTASAIALLLSLCCAAGMLVFFKEHAYMIGMVMTCCAMGSCSFGRCAMLCPMKDADEPNEDAKAKQGENPGTV